MPDNWHHAELRVVQIALDRQLQGNSSLRILEQRDRQTDRQVQRIRAVDPFTQLQLLHQHLVLSLELTFGDQVVQVEIEPALADPETGELSGVGSQVGQLDTLEAGGDIQAGHRVERVEAAFDGHRRVSIDLALDVHGCGCRLAVVDGADTTIELLHGGGKVGGQGHVGKVCRAILDIHFADVDRQRVICLGLGLCSGCFCLRCGLVIRLRNQQIVDIGGPVFIDHEACVRLIHVDFGNRKARAVLVVQPFELQLLPLQEVALFERVECVKLIDLRFAGNAERQRFGAFQVDRQIAAQHAAAHFQTNERADVGLGEAQVYVAGSYVKLCTDWVEVHIAGCSEVALFAQPGIKLKREGGFVKAVEILDVQIQRANIQSNRLLRYAICQVDHVIAQLHISQQHLPWRALRGGLGAGFGRGVDGGCRFSRLVVHGRCLRCRWLARLAGE